MATNSGSAQSAPPKRTPPPPIEESETQKPCLDCGLPLPGPRSGQKHNDPYVCIALLQGKNQHSEAVIERLAQVLGQMYDQLPQNLEERLTTGRVAKQMLDSLAESGDLPLWPIGLEVTNAFPLGYWEAPGRPGTVAKGTYGRVTTYLDDGRIGVEFDGHNGLHTFDKPFPVLKRIDR